MLNIMSYNNNAISNYVNHVNAQILILILIIILILILFIS